MSTRTSLAGGFTVAVLAAALILSGYGAAVALGPKTGSATTVTTTTTATNSSTLSPYVLTLVITTNNMFNASAGDQPVYYVLGPAGLESAANINLPANRLIKLVIVNYDDGNASLAIPSDNVVSGTINGTIFVASNDNVNSSQGPSGIVLAGGVTQSTVPASEVAHTFTVPSINLNVPVPLSSTVVAYFTLASPGTFIWFCETECGCGLTGTQCAMSSPGWMTGNLVAS